MFRSVKLQTSVSSESPQVHRCGSVRNTWRASSTLIPLFAPQSCSTHGSRDLYEHSEQDRTKSPRTAPLPQPTPARRLGRADGDATRSSSRFRFLSRRGGERACMADSTKALRDPGLTGTFGAFGFWGHACHARARPARPRTPSTAEADGVCRLGLGYSL